ncbi:MAG: hypothetical protein OEZ04_08725 [Nitrospinota bacterium]|nr:hypothetical protein [Nitrospinota bacterium]
MFKKLQDGLKRALEHALQRSLGKIGLPQLLAAYEDLAKQDTNPPGGPFEGKGGGEPPDEEGTDGELAKHI